VIASSLLPALTWAGCGSPGPPRSETNVVEPGHAHGPIAEMMRLLAADAVDDHRFARATLYTWTTTDQIDALRTSRRLLVRDESPTSGASYLDQVLYVLAQHGDPLAAALYTTPFANMRFAWSTPWPTRAGWPDETYGDQLIRVSLRPEALVVSVSTTTGRFEVHDLHDRVISVDAARKQLDRIAAIYFVSDDTQPNLPGLPPPTTSFREYALCNEAMIASWEVGTARLEREVAEAAATVDAIVRYVEAEHPIVIERVARAWSRIPPGDPIAAYHAALALDSPNYRLEAAALRTVARLLRETRRVPALEGASTVAFQPGTARKPPRVVARSRDVSFARPTSPTAAQP